MVEIKTPHCRWWLLLSTPPHCLFVFPALIYFHKPPLSLLPTSFIFFRLHILFVCLSVSFFFLFFFAFYPHPLSQLCSRTTHCQEAAHQTKTSIQMAGFVKTNRDKHSPQTKKKEDAAWAATPLWCFQASGCANNRISVVCASGTFRYSAGSPTPFVSFAPFAKTPAGCCCITGAYGCLPVKCSCQLTKVKVAFVVALAPVRRALRSLASVEPGRGASPQTPLTVLFSGFLFSSCEPTRWTWTGTRWRTR